MTFEEKTLEYLLWFWYSHYLLGRNLKNEWKVELNGISHIRYVENMHGKTALESKLKTNVPDFICKP